MLCSKLSCLFHAQNYSMAIYYLWKIKFRFLRLAFSTAGSLSLSHFFQTCLPFSSMYPTQQSHWTALIISWLCWYASWLCSYLYLLKYSSLFRSPLPQVFLNYFSAFSDTFLFWHTILGLRYRFLSYMVFIVIDNNLCITYCVENSTWFIVDIQ